ncbi:MAG: flavin reductase family protein [Candidatus Aenigmatarchaeota archaeon]
MRIDPSKAYRLLSPRIVVLLATANSKHGMNAIPIDFIIPVNYLPPIIMVAIQQGGQTYRNIKESGEFVVNIMSKKYLNEVMRCAKRYQEGINKIQQVGLHHFSSQFVRAPRIREAKAWLECKLVDEIVFKDHVAIFAEIVVAEVSDEIVTNGEIDYSRINPILHITKDYSIEFRATKKKKIKNSKRLKLPLFFSFFLFFFPVFSFIPSIIKLFGFHFFTYMSM